MQYGHLEKLLRPQIYRNTSKNSVINVDITKKIREGGEKRDSIYKKNMKKIINSLPVTKSTINKITKELDDLGTNFVNYCQCQANLTDEEDPDTWSASLLDLAVLVLNRVEEENPTVMI